MSKKHVFLQFFSKIAIFACVFCTISAWAETTTCDIDYTPVTGNSIQNGTPTPTNPVAIESVGTKVGNKYAVQVAVNYDGGVVDLGTLNWRIAAGENGLWSFVAAITDLKGQEGTGPNVSRLEGIYVDSDTYVLSARYFAYAGNFALENDHYIKAGLSGDVQLHIRNDNFSDATAFKQAMSGVMLYYQRTTDETWTAPTLKTVYLDEPLRKVGDYADILDYKNGTITRNVGVKVLDGTEDGWTLYSSSGADAGLIYNEKIITDNKLNISLLYMFVTHFQVTDVTTVPVNCARFQGVPRAISHRLYLKRSADDTLSSFKSWLASQYAAGTPVIVYYPLETPVVEQIENWSCIPPITDIKIATTKYVDDEFAPLNTALANAISVVDNVVTQTIAQAGQIATLQNTKQTRPSDDNECPAGKKCLLVTDESGTPHWYEIVEPKLVSDGYTQLEYIESTGTQWIDTGIYGTEKHGLEIKYSYPKLNSSYSGRLCGVRTGADSVNAYAYIGTSNGILGNSDKYYVSSNNATTWTSSKVLDTSIHTASVNILNDNESYFDGQQIITGLTTPYTHTVTTNIFRAYNGTSYAVPTVARVYYCRLTNNGEDIRNLIPAKRNSDNVVGMYDTVSGTFFTNAGTGSFVAGPVVF